MKIPKPTAPTILILVAIILFVAVAAAITYKLAASNPVDVNVSNQVITIPVLLATSSADIVEGQQVTLTATATGPDAANSLGKTVTFMEGASTVGVASIQLLSGQYKASVTLTPTPGLHTYSTAAEP